MHFYVSEYKGNSFIIVTFGNKERKTSMNVLPFLMNCITGKPK